MASRLEPFSGITADYLNLLQDGTVVVAISLHRSDQRYAQVWVNGVEFRVPAETPVAVPKAVADLLQGMRDITVRVIEERPWRAKNLAAGEAVADQTAEEG